MKRKVLGVLFTAMCLCAVPSAAYAEAQEAETTEAAGEAADEPEAGAETVTALSDSLYDFQVKIWDKVYQFPMYYQDFAADWTLGKNEDPEMGVGTNSYGSISFYKGDDRVSVDVINLGINQLPLNQCLVAGIDIDASYDFDVARFFTKWLADMAADQRPDGSIGHVVPTLYVGSGSAAWDDAAAICPWQIYLTYGDKEILRQQFDCMKKYIGFITNSTKDPYLWTGGEHYEDWLGLDAPVGSYKGSSRADFIASAFYAYSTSLVVKAGRVLGEDISEYERLYQGIVDTFRKTFTDYRTQTAHVLAVHFGLAEDPQKTADAMAEMIKACGSKLQTGFVGTPYLLHVLSSYGHTELAYTLLLRTEYPSWLYPVTKGATTVWEHWDGIMENGDFWSTDMNSFNHYAYGAVADWVYEAAAGIQTVEDAPGFARVKIAPQPDSRLDWLEASIETRKGTVRSLWKQEEGRIRYEITTPSPAEIVIAGKTMEVEAGDYIFYSEIA